MNDKYTGYLGQKFRDDYRPRTGSSSSQALFTYPQRVILSLLARRPRIFPYPRTEYWAWPFSYTGCMYMRMDIRPGLLQCSLDTGYQLAPTVQVIYILYSIIFFFIKEYIVKSNFYILYVENNVHSFYIHYEIYL